MTIGFDAKRYYHNHTGLGNYSRTLIANLRRCYPDVECRLYDAGVFRRTLTLARRAAAEGCNLYHGLSNEVPMIAPGGGVATVVTVHDVAWRTFPAMYHRADRLIYDFKYGRSCRTATRVVAISESTAADVRQFYGVPAERISVVYQPCAAEYYEPLTGAEAELRLRRRFTEAALPDDFVLYVGSLNSRKNCLALLQALTLMPAETRPFLLIVGDGREYRRRVEAFIEANGLAPYTLIASDIHDNALLQALYRRARVMVYPSFYEGFGLPVVEAALQQTPVITTTVSSLPEAAGPDGILIDPRDPYAPRHIARRLSTLLSEPDTARAVGEAMERYARQRFDPKRLTDEMMKVYLDTLQQH